MTTPTYATLTHNGLWKNNPALVQLLGLCPLLAVSASVVNSLGLAAATLFVLISSNLCVSVVRNVVSDTIRLPVFVMIIAASVTAIELLMQAYTYELYQILGIFLPLITTNCIILSIQPLTLFQRSRDQSSSNFKHSSRVTCFYVHS